MMRVDRAIRYKGSYRGAMVLRQRLEDQGVHVEFPRKDRKRLERAQRRLQEWQVLIEQAELLERQDREQRELLQRLDQGPRELRLQHMPELGELDRRQNREREEMGLPLRGWDAEPWAEEPAPLVSLRQMFAADLDQVGISLKCTGAAAAIAETVEEFREVAPGCEVEVQEEPHTASTAPLVSLRRIFGAAADGDAVVLAGGTGETGRAREAGRAGEGAGAGTPHSAAKAASAGKENGARVGPGQSPMDGEVTVVPGIPRYHQRACILIRLLSDDDLETPTRREAEAAGSVPCKACHPEPPG